MNTTEIASGSEAVSDSQTEPMQNTLHTSPMQFSDTAVLGKRKILIVEDNELNRAILTEILSERYDVIEACNGEEGLTVLAERYREISLVVLDVYMPVCDGFEFLERVGDDALLSTVPVIVATGSNISEDEIRCLRLGAADFVSKPYNPQVVLGRIYSTIRLRESAAALSAVEYDNITGVYTMAAFIHHAERILKTSTGDYDVAALSVRSASTVNNIYGREQINGFISYCAEQLRQCFTDALIGRDGLSFYLLFPSDRYIPCKESIEHFRNAMKGKPLPNVTCTLGYYHNVDKSQKASMLCTRAHITAQSIEKDLNKNVAVFDKAMEERLTRNQLMEESFDDAIKNREFKVWLQPKVNALTGKVEAAEALVRWIDAKGNMVPPGAFIPLFEGDGLIADLDEYMFRAVCGLQHTAIAKGYAPIPISVNLSRNSLFSSDVVENYYTIASNEEVPLDLVPLELTESAVGEDAILLDVCNKFVAAGFVLHIDDFGTGYSSFSSLSTFPFSVVKLDKRIIDCIGSESGDIVVRNAITIVRELGMSTVAEGVETLDQLKFLQDAGCDTIQGFLFSPPVAAKEFESIREKEATFSKETEEAASLVSHREGFASSEVQTCLRACRAVFPQVRLIEENCHKAYNVDEGGNLTEDAKKCFDIWGREKPCDNCICNQALESSHTIQKFEVLGNQLYLIIAKRFKVGDEYSIIEMLDVVGEEVLEKFQNSPKLMEAVRAVNKELYREAQLDIYNRRFFEERVDSLENITAIAMVDLDNFKEVNDTLGHHAGDVALRTVVDAIRNNVRESDVLMRYGGDEVLIAFAGMKREAFAGCLEKIRKAVENLEIPEYPDIHATISIGGYFCGTFSRDAVIAADHEMYAVKGTGNSISVSFAPED